MTDLILHHYATSPFSEKVRLILGYKDLPWKSVTVPVILPKPDVLPLTGGYRRTPFLQIGADIYCDTALIAQVLESIHPLPKLVPSEHAAAVFAMAQWADTTLFWATVSYVTQPAGFQSLFGSLPEAFVKAFIEDRKAMREGGTGMRTPLPEATTTLHVFLAQLERQLATGERIFLFGHQPTVGRQREGQDPHRDPVGGVHSGSTASKSKSQASGAGWAAVASVNQTVLPPAVRSVPQRLAIESSSRTPRPVPASARKCRSRGGTGLVSKTSTRISSELCRRTSTTPEWACRMALVTSSDTSSAAVCPSSASPHAAKVPSVSRRASATRRGSASSARRTSTVER